MFKRRKLFGTIVAIATLIGLVGCSGVEKIDTNITPTPDAGANVGLITDYPNYSVGEDEVTPTVSKTPYADVTTGPSPTPIMSKDDVIDAYFPGFGINVTPTPVPTLTPKPTPTKKPTPSPTKEVKATSTPKPTATPIPNQDTLNNVINGSFPREGIIKSTVNVRTGAGTNNSKLGTMNAGARVSVDGYLKDKDGDYWYKIYTTGGQTGYVYYDYVAVLKTGSSGSQSGSQSGNNGNKEQTQTTTVTSKDGTCSAYYNNKVIKVKVDVNNKNLKGDNERSAVLIGKKAEDLLEKYGSGFDGLLKSGYQWCVVHYTVTIQDDSLGYASNCNLDINVTSSSGSKLNGVNTLYYIETLDAYGDKYDNSTSYTKEYDLVFMLPSGVNKFNVEFGRKTGTVWTYSYK